jgi:hypothetical protein
MLCAGLFSNTADYFACKPGFRNAPFLRVLLFNSNRPVMCIDTRRVEHRNGRHIKPQASQKITVLLTVSAGCMHQRKYPVRGPVSYPAGYRLDDTQGGLNMKGPANSGDPGLPETQNLQAGAGKSPAPSGQFQIPMQQSAWRGVAWLV